MKTFKEIQEFLKNLKLNDVLSDSRIVGEIHLNLQTESSPFLYSFVTLDGNLIWTRWGAEGVKTSISLEEYPNLATEVPLIWLVKLRNCKLPWEIVTLQKHKGLFLRIVRDESHYQYVPKEFIAQPNTDTGYLIWGDGKGDVKSMRLYPSFTRPDLES